MMRAIVLALTMLLFSVASSADETPTFLGHKIHPDAPAAVHHWGQIIGNWDIRWEAYDTEGTIRSEGKANWFWRSTLGGFAIQDFYTHPMKDPARPDRIGTNLRVFDADKNRWHIRWSHNYGKGFEEFTAVQQGDEIIMFENGKETSSRIRFFDFTPTSFRQQEEKSADGGKSWSPSFAAWATKHP